MANFLQRIFYEEYQCLVLDMIKAYDVHHRHDRWTTHNTNSDAKRSETSYSIRDKKFFIVVTRSYDESVRPNVSYRLYMEDNRPASPIPYQALQQDTKFAQKIYHKMLNKYQDTHNVR